MQFKNFNNIPSRLQTKIEVVRQESDEYAADELIELGEDILTQLAAMGLAVYLQQAKQKEVFNDFIISLFLSNVHAYNAGPLYRWVANMLKDAEGEQANLLRNFFWETNEQGYEVLNTEIHHLASLRNDVMHGFFVLPPETNRSEAQKMELILTQLETAGLFETNFGDFHFHKNTAFTGQWNIQDPLEWKLLESDFEFGKLAKRISYEYSEDFTLEEKKIAYQVIEKDLNVNQKATDFLQKGKGAMVCWYQPGNENGIATYQNLVQGIDTEIYFPIYYSLHEKGATFTAAFLNQILVKALIDLTCKKEEIKDPFKFLKTAKLDKKPVLILHNIHLALFNENHLTKLFNACYEVSLPILCTAWYYPYLKRYVNAEVFIKSETSNEVVETLFMSSLQNYVRFKGPSKEQVKDVEHYRLLEKIVRHLNDSIQSESSVIARRFADKFDYPIEFVHEAFSILTPFYKFDREEFIKDEVDELYGFPKTIEESSRIFLSLGRRDVKLEYKHKVLIKN
jgi:hypothetical protein